MRFAISWVPDDLRSYPELVRATEDAGFEALGVPDTQAAAYRECYVTLTAAALNSTRLRLGPWVTNPVSRHPAVTAAALASIDELAPGRALAVIASGDTSVRNIGLQPASLATVEAYVRTVRSLLHGEPAEWQGRTARVLWPKGGVSLLIGAGGPRTVALAGEIADGVVLGFPVSPETVVSTRDTLAKGAARAGRDAAQLERWWRLTVCVADSYDNALALALPSLASMAKNAYSFTLEGKGVPESLAGAVRQLQQRYDVSAHNRPGADSPNAVVLRELGLVDFVAERFGVLGTPRQVAHRLSELGAMGVDAVQVRVNAPDRLGFLRLWREQIVPAVR